MTKIHDIAVMGGGPAGCVTAKRLRELGYSVVLITHAHRRARLEGISERTVQALKNLGFNHALNLLSPPVVRDSMWADEFHSINREYLIHRHEFDRALEQQVVDSQMDVHHGKIGKYVWSDNNSHWAVNFQSKQTNAAEMIYCKFLVEARGRLAPKLTSQISRGPLTLSIGQNFQLPDTEGYSAVTSFEQGWGWLAVLKGGRARMQFMLDGKIKLSDSEQNLTNIYRVAFEQLPEAKKWLEHAKPIDKPTACGAGMQLNDTVVTTKMIRVGDAATAPDPLSGQGVYESIGGALSAISTVNTLLKYPERSDMAIKFYRQRCEDRFYYIGRVAKDFYQQEQRFPNTSFWNNRFDWPDENSMPRLVGVTEACIEQRTVVQNNILEQASVIVSPDYPRGIWCVSDVPVVALYEYLRASDLAFDVVATAQFFKKNKQQIIMARNFLLKEKLLTD